MGEQSRKIVDQWFSRFWGGRLDTDAVDEFAAPDMVLQCSLFRPVRGREAIKAFIGNYRAAMPDLRFRQTGDSIVDGDYVVVSWEGGGTNSGAALKYLLAGHVPAASGRRLDFSGTSILRVANDLIAHEVGIDDGLIPLLQLGLRQPVGVGFE